MYIHQANSRQIKIPEFIHPFTSHLSQSIPTFFKMACILFLYPRCPPPLTSTFSTLECSTGFRPATSGVRECKRCRTAIKRFPSMRADFQLPHHNSAIHIQTNKHPNPYLKPKPSARLLTEYPVVFRITIDDTSCHNTRYGVPLF